MALLFYLLSLIISIATNASHTTLLSYVSVISSGTQNSFTFSSKFVTTHTLSTSYTLLTSVETNIRESSTQLESATVTLPSQTYHTHLRTPLASTSVTVPSKQYNQSELLTTLTQL